MVDVATVSVVSSAVVAVGTIAANFIGGERQRRHEADLDFEKRVWERKSEALFTVIEQCRTLVDSDSPLTDDNRVTWAMDLSKMLDALGDVRATVEAFASSRCRSEMTKLMEALLDQGVTYYDGHQAERFHTLMMEVPMSEPFQVGNVMDEVKQRGRYAKWAKEAEERAVADFAPDLDDLQGRARRLLEAARESVRSPKD